MNCEPVDSAALTQTIRMILVDDHTVVRQGTRDLLTSTPLFEIVQEAAEGETLARILSDRQASVDLVLLDLNLPGKNGLDWLAELRPKHPDVRFVLFSAFTDAQYVRRALQLGARGYLSKALDGPTLQRLLRQVMRTADNAPALLSEDVAQIMASQEKPFDEAVRMLTPREQEILLHVARGGTNRDIAGELILSVKTVDSHVASLIRKTGVKNRAQLTALAYEHGLL
jgi:DNA-binding NarL/FixJ family response regulator